MISACKYFTEKRKIVFGRKSWNDVLSVNGSLINLEHFNPIYAQTKRNQTQQRITTEITSESDPH